MSEHPVDPPAEELEPPGEPEGVEDLEAMLASLGQDPYATETSEPVTAGAPPAPEPQAPADQETADQRLADQWLAAQDPGALSLDGAETDPLSQINTALEALGKGMDWVLDQLTAHPAGGPWFWQKLDEASEKALWKELGDFVLWLNNRLLRHIPNTVEMIPDCWYRHPDGVEQLTALMVAHKAAYLAKSEKASFELVNWFDRALWPTLRSFEDKGTFTRCLTEDHQDSVSEEYTHDSGFADFFTGLGTTMPGDGDGDGQMVADA